MYMYITLTGEGLRAIYYCCTFISTGIHVHVHTVYMSIYRSTSLLYSTVHFIYIVHILGVEITVDEAMEKIGFGPFQVLVTFFTGMLWVRV